MKYRTKPFMINAIQFTGLNTSEIMEFTGYRFRNAPVSGFQVWDYLQNTWVGVNFGDYIIRGMKGEFYPCEQEVFEAKYEVYDSDSE